jgi:nicotinate-nucleotide adenylyltransferase
MTPRLALRRFGSLAVRTPLALPGQRIGIMGGSFNPPHAGHLAVSETALRRLDLDRLWWVVTPGNPLKSKDGLPPLARRIAACRALLSDPRIEVTGFEADLGSPYTAETLAFLKSRFPRTHLVWVMGADNLASFDRWQDWRRIAALMPIAVVDRPYWRLPALASPAAHALGRYRIPESAAASLPRRRAPAWTYLGTRLSDLSSSQIRGKVRAWAILRASLTSLRTAVLGVLMTAGRKRIFHIASKRLGHHAAK